MDLDGRTEAAARYLLERRAGALRERAFPAWLAPPDEAGAYAIQGAIAAWIARIDGSHSGIMGLPLYETATLLRAAGVAVA